MRRHNETKYHNEYKGLYVKQKLWKVEEMKRSLVSRSYQLRVVRFMTGEALFLWNLIRKKKSKPKIGDWLIFQVLSCDSSLCLWLILFVQLNLALY